VNRNSMNEPRSMLTSTRPDSGLAPADPGTKAQPSPSQRSTPELGRQSDAQTASVARPAVAAAAAIQPDTGLCGTSSAHAASVARTQSPIKTIAARQTPKWRSATSQGGEPRTGYAAEPRHTRLKTRVPLVPPKPKLFLTAYSIFISRAVLAQ